MKKIIASALGLMLGGTIIATTAHAEIENQFGGYWRTRFSFQDNMQRYPGESTFNVDTRTRLYYTAKFNENLKFVNKFEMDAVWGDDGYGDIGADGKDFEVKNSYVDAKFGAANVKVGVQWAGVHRGTVFDDDFAGIVATSDFGAVTPVVVWGRAMDKKFGGVDQDLDMLHAGAKIKIGDAVTINPGVTALLGSRESKDTTEDLVTGFGEPLQTTVTETSPVGDQNLMWFGVDLDVKLDAVKMFGTFVYQTGDVLGVDSNAMAGIFGVDAGIVHGGVYYSSGDDASDPSENTQFTGISAYVVTAEIMGMGSTIDATFGPGITPWDFTNIMLGNVGTTLKPADNLKIDVNGWYGALAEDNEMGNSELGFELDAKLTIKLLEKLNVDFFAAYLVAGDATNDAAGNTDDVMEGGSRLSLKF